MSRQPGRSSRRAWIGRPEIAAVHQAREERKRPVGRVSRMLALPALAALAVVALPGVAAAEPVVPDQSLRDAVYDLGVGQAVFPLDLSQAVVSLREESTVDGKTTVRISADVLFEFGKANLTDVARSEIEQLATRLRGISGGVQVAGFTDSVGAPASNLSFSQRRADAVKAELAKQAGGVVIAAIGRGEANPVAPNTKDGKDYPTGRAKNRRVEITFNAS